jgi:hypothetical protein
MDDESQVEKPGFAVAMSNRDLVSILVLGGIVGLLLSGLGLVLNRYVFDVFFCQNGTGGQCANATAFAEGAATVIASIFGLIGLIRLRAYRPLLIVLASAISLWGLAQLTWGAKWYLSVVIAVVMYLLAYGLFAWVARVRKFWIALVLTIILVIATRLVLSL